MVLFLFVVLFAISNLEILPQNKDSIMSGLFEKLDEFFLRKQKIAFVGLF